MSTKHSQERTTGPVELIGEVKRILSVTPKHDMRGIGYGDNGEGDEGDRAVRSKLKTAGGAQRFIL